MEDTVISIKNLTKKYKVYNRKKDRLIETLFPFVHKHRTFTALDNINLELKKGEILGILGKNGAGKSTLLKIITGVVTETSGEMTINGKISSLLELGTAFNGELTGYENIYQHGQVFGFTKEEIKKKEAEIIAFADIGEHLNQPVKTYSSGMFARLAFACAISIEPDILIIDEILAVGDLNFQLKCFKKIEEFKNKGTTVLFVSHSLNDILINCTRAIIIDSGNKIAEGSSKEMVDKYKKMITVNEQKNIQINNNLSKNKFNYYKEKLNINLGHTSYGNKEIEIVDYCVLDSKNNIATSFFNNEEMDIYIRCKPNINTKDVMIAFAIKNFNGVELCGASEGIKQITADDEIEIRFKQVIPLQNGKYTLSLGCTKIDELGNTIIFHRIYDVLILQITSTVGMIGQFALDTTILIEGDK